MPAHSAADQPTSHFGTGRAPPAVGVENGTEHARRIEVRKAPLVDRSPGKMSGRCSGIADDRAVPKRSYGQSRSRPSSR
jgi:hypothetical protein